MKIACEFLCKTVPPNRLLNQVLTGIEVCSGCAGDYEDPDRTAPEPDADSWGEVNPDEVEQPLEQPMLQGPVTQQNECARW